MSLDESLARDLQSKPWRAFLRDNPGIGPLVEAYLTGGPRPNLSQLEPNHYAVARVLAEDERRKQTPPPPTGSKLRDKPPGYPDYAGYQRVSLGGSNYREFPDNQDVLLDIGDHSYEEGISLVGGRNVVIIGGRITAVGLARAAGVGLAVWPRTAQSHYYIEGVRIQPSKRADGTWRRTLCDSFASRGPVGKITIQNCLFGPTAVKEGYDTSIHPDVFQYQAPFDGDVRVHRFTGLTEYTGVMCSSVYVRSQNWSHTNFVAVRIGGPSRGHTVFGIYDSGIPITLPGVTFDEFYWQKDPDQGFQGYSPIELVTQKGGKYGKPTGGDFVTEEMVGPGYVSPGYL